MQDVAEAAGVSRALVSIVMRGVPGASDDTRAHVTETARRLGYVPDARARALRQQGRQAIGVAFQPERFHTALIDGIYAAAQGTGHPVVLSAVTDLHDEDTALTSLVADRCGALITLGARLDEERLRVISSRAPVIAVARTLRSPDLEFVASDDHVGLSMAVEYLVTLGHRRIAFCEAPGSSGNPERCAGYVDAMTRHDLAPLIDIIASGANEEAGAAAALSLLARDELPDAVIAFNDACAAGIQDVLVRAGIAIPGDVSLVGFDDSDISRISYRRITTVRQDIAALSRLATERALARMRGEPVHPGGHIVPTALVVRDTTGPVT
ncbi:LacI family transcriptional regulator [Tessaracoccus sp. HDW20]|uniref:LacI family DNA-binding transcriptional regulator n=1 Tax=Tessaracoccus coleopterorum TaxID=2714950 RepID=UPI0018D4AC2C|nr:LacI family DNA-binding transcriptional regulator [Tessaracoccus coleopterorum]NHB84044.1 LacI family transcriptional regulator [Tessaracoccus coleopterorum]